MDKAMSYLNDPSDQAIVRALQAQVQAWSSEARPKKRDRHGRAGGPSSAGATLAQIGLEIMRVCTQRGGRRRGHRRDREGSARRGPAELLEAGHPEVIFKDLLGNILGLRGSRDLGRKRRKGA